MAAPWGAYLAPASGEGDALIWFSSQAALCAFLAGPLWAALAGVEAAPDDAAALRELLSVAQPLRWEVLEQVNQRLAPLGQLHWWGSLAQLYEGEDPFAKDLREAWRDGAGRGPQDFSALSEAERRSFCGFLATVFNP